MARLSDIRLRRSAVSGSIPSTSNLNLGELALNTADGKVYMKKSVGGTDTIVEVGGSASGIASTFIAYEYTATANQTTFSGTDNNSNTLAYNTGTPPSVQVFMNGILLDEGSSQDYTGTNGTSVVLTTAADAGDLIQIHAYKSDVSIVNNLNFNDNQKLQFGDSQDLQIYHDGSNSYIKDVGTGTLNLQGATQVLIGSATTGEVGLQFIEDGGVGLRHNNVTKFFTTSTGIDVTGTVTATGDVRADTHFNSTDTNATLSATGSGNVYLRPNGKSSTTGQVHIATSGNATFNGTISSGAITSTGKLTLNDPSVGGWIQSNGSVRIDIDNDNNQTDRAFIVSKNNSASNLLTIFESGAATFAGTISSGAITSTGTSTFGVVTSSSYKVGASTVIDNSRNLLNIGTISSGAITSSGLLTLNDYAMINAGTTSNTTLERVIWARSQIGASVVQMNVQGDEWQFGGGGTLDTTPILKLKNSTNAATFAGTISSGAITSTGTSSFGSISLSGGVDFNGYNANGVNQINGASSTGWLDFNMDTDSVYPQSTTDNQTVLGSVTHINFVGDSNGNGVGGIFYWGYGTDNADNGTFTQTMELDRSGNLTTVGKITSTELEITGGAGNTDLYIRNTSPTLGFTDTNSFTDSNDIYIIRGLNNAIGMQWYDNSANTTTTTFEIDSAGNTDITGSLTATGLDINGNADISGVLTMSHNAAGNMLNMNNNSIIGVNSIVMADPGPSEGVTWSNIKIYESPDDLTTNSAGNFQVTYGNTRKLTVNNNGIDVNGTITTSGTLYGPSSFTIDPAGHDDNTGTVIIAGNLQVDGTTTTINSTTLDVDDLNITLAKGTTSSGAANGAGILVEGPSGGGAQLVYESSNDRWTLNKEVFSSQGFMIGTTATDVGLIKNSSGVFDFQAQSAREISFSNVTNGEHVRIDATGNVGIGTDTPGRKLHVSGAGATVAVKVEATDGVQSSLDLKNSEGEFRLINDGGALSIYDQTDTTERFRIDTSGNVGIGVTSLTNGDKLTVDGNIKLNGKLFNGTSNNSAGLDFTSNYVNYHGYAGHRFYAQAAGIGSMAERMCITVDGKVGIGTNAPVKTLEISYSSSDTNAGGQGMSGGGAGAGLLIRNTNTTAGIYANLDFRANNADGRISYKYNGTNDGDFHFITDNGDSLSSQMVIKNNGNVGIGTINPTDPLVVQSSGSSMGGGATLTNSFFTITDGTTSMFHDPNELFSNINGSFHIGATHTNGLLRFQTGGTSTRMVILANGNVGIGQVDPKASFQVDHAGIDTYAVNTSATSAAQVDTFSATEFRSARFTVQITNTTDSTYQITEIILIHDGTTPSMTEYGTIFTGSAREASFDADIVSGNVRLLATPASTDSMQFKVVRHSILV